MGFRKIRAAVSIKNIALLFWTLGSSALLAEDATPVATALPAQQAAASDPAAAAVELEFFENRVRPILAEHCYQCHSADSTKGGLRLDTRAGFATGGDSGAPVVAGEPDQSVLIQAIRYDADGYRMPPKGKLADDQIATLTEWVQHGAHWPADRITPEAGSNGTDSSAGTKGSTAWRGRLAHWSFQPLRPTTIPEVSTPVQNPIDAYVLAAQQSRGLGPAATADRGTLWRRLSFDLVGLPPDPAELTALANDPDPLALDRGIDRLLASPHFGERWGRHWLDLVRYAETQGHEFDYELPVAWRYRDYVIRAWNADLPYDQWIREHFAGDLVQPQRLDPRDGRPESVLGTGFFWLSQGKHSPVDIRGEECDLIDNQLDVLGKTFLGLTIACARCHDHKFDPLTQADYHGLAGVLQSSRRQLADLSPPERLSEQLAELAKLNGEWSLKWQAADEKRLETTALQLPRYWQPSVAEYSGKSWLVPNQLVSALSTEQFSGAALSESRQLQLTQARADRHSWLFACSLLCDVTNQAELRGRIAELLAEWSAVGREQHSRSVAVATARDLDPSQSMHAADDRRMEWNLASWQASGPAFGSGPAEGGERIWDSGATPQLVELAMPGSWHSGLIAGSLHGAVRSPTFAIDRRYLSFRARRVGGQPAPPGRRNKLGQVHLIVDGFHLIQWPLWGQLSVNLPQNMESRWYHMDLDRLQGHKAYLEVEDVDDGYVVIEQVVTADQPNQETAINSWAVRLFEQEPPETSQQLADSLALTALAAVDHWRGMFVGRPEEVREPGDRQAETIHAIEIINHLLSWQRIASRQLGAGATQGASLSPAARTAWERRLELIASLPQPVSGLAMTDGSPEDDVILIRGNPQKLGATVQRRTPEFLGGQPLGERSASGRLELAESLADPRHPLVARVAVNRLWQHLFGRGLVPTPDDFGHMGQPPSHPELLDYLASELIRRDWSLKAMVRLMVTSATYQQASSRRDPQTMEADPQNIWLTRMSVRRLEAEAIRDTLLAISGRLDDRLEGESVMPQLTDFMEGRGRPGVSGPLDSAGRRSVYIAIRRNFLPPFLLAFDFPTPFTTVGRRTSSNVPAQALILLNNEFVQQQAALWARSLMAAEQDPTQRVRRAYVEAFGRQPTLNEVAAGLEFLGPNAESNDWAEYCHALWNLKELIYIE